MKIIKALIIAASLVLGGGVAAEPFEHTNGACTPFEVALEGGTPAGFYDTTDSREVYLLFHKKSNDKIGRMYITTLPNTTTRVGLIWVTFEHCTIDRGSVALLGMVELQNRLHWVFIPATQGGF